MYLNIIGYFISRGCSHNKLAPAWNSSYCRPTPQSAGGVENAGNVNVESKSALIILSRVTFLGSRFCLVRLCSEKVYKSS